MSRNDVPCCGVELIQYTSVGPGDTIVRGRRVLLVGSCVFVSSYSRLFEARRGDAGAPGPTSGRRFEGTVVNEEWQELSRRWTARRRWRHVVSFTRNKGFVVEYYAEFSVSAEILAAQDSAAVVDAMVAGRGRDVAEVLSRGGNPVWVTFSNLESDTATRVRATSIVGALAQLPSARMAEGGTYIAMIGERALSGLGGTRFGRGFGRRSLWNDVGVLGRGWAGADTSEAEMVMSLLEAHELVTGVAGTDLAGWRVEAAEVLEAVRRLGAAGS